MTTNDLTPAEREAREAMRWRYSIVGHSLGCSSARFIKTNRHTGLDMYGSSGKPCDCGADAKCEATLDAYATAVRQAERDRLVVIIAETRKRCDLFCVDSGRCFCPAFDVNQALDAILAKLKEGA